MSHVLRAYSLELVSVELYEALSSNYGCQFIITAIITLLLCVLITLSLLSSSCIFNVNILDNSVDGSNSQSVKKFLTFCGNWSFMSEVRNALLVPSLSQMHPFTLSHYSPLRSILILSSNHSQFFPSSLRTNILHRFSLLYLIVYYSLRSHCSKVDKFLEFSKFKFVTCTVLCFCAGAMDII
jgi:hypothetical protein